MATPRILIVEDEFLLADDMAAQLAQCGAEVIGYAANLDKAMELAERLTDVDAAVVDINLCGKSSYPVIEALNARGVKVVLCTGYERQDIPDCYSDVPLVPKPVHTKALLAALEA